MKKSRLLTFWGHILTSLLILTFIVTLPLVSLAEYDECLGIPKEDKTESNRFTQDAIDSINLGLFEEAINYCNLALDLDPCNRFAFAMRGTAYVKKGIKTKNSYLKREYIASGKSDLEKSCRMKFENACKFLEEITKKGY